MRKLRNITAAMAAAVLLMGGVIPASAETVMPEGQAELMLRAVCRCDGETPEDGALTFVLWDGQHNILQMVVNLRQYAAFAPLHFSAPGRYVYYISQESGRDISIAYDPALYQIVVEVWQGEGQLSARVAEINRVKGDWVGEAEVLEALGPDGMALFENLSRETPPWAEVPDTGNSTAWWSLLCFCSAGALLWTAIASIRRKNERGRT